MPAKKTAEKETKLNFEDALTRLEEIADILENSSPSLEQALALYEQGAKLLKECTVMLDEAQKKITVLTKE